MTAARQAAQWAAAGGAADHGQPHRDGRAAPPPYRGFPVRHAMLTGRATCRPARQGGGMVGPPAGGRSAARAPQDTAYRTLDGAAPGHRTAPLIRQPEPLLPQNRREVFALICFGLLLWLGAVVTVAGIAGWSAGGLVAFGGGGAVGILAAGLFYAWRFRR